MVSPLYFLEDKLSVDYPPPISHAEFYYGFAGAVLALQLMYLLIATDPVRYRPVMLLAIAAKGIFAISIAVLAYHGVPRD